MSELQRIRKVIKWLYFCDKIESDADLADKLGYARSSLSQILNGKVPLSGKFIDGLLSMDENVNRVWVTRGKGPMLKDDKPVPLVTDIGDELTLAPLISQFAYAGYLNGFGDAIYLESQPHYVAARKYSKGNYVAFEIRGDSMDDNSNCSICDGDIVLGRELDKSLWSSGIILKRVYIIVHRTDGILCKMIAGYSQESGYLTCHSFNPEPEYHDFDLHINDIRQLFTVKEISRKNKF